MMDVREKLIELIAKAKYICANDYSDHTEDEYIADTLLDNGVTVQDWISVNDRLPEPYVSVLVHMPGAKPCPTVRKGFISNDGIWQSEMFRREPGEVTHWKPMPQPPKGE